MGCAQDNINPHKSLPRGERHARTRRVPTVARFNPRPRAGSDEDFCTAYDYSHKLQSTLPHGSDFGLTRSMISLSCFNPRSRTGSDLRAAGFERPFQLASIHAPARGATFDVGGLLAAQKASIHAPARGATGALPRCQALPSASIHAPARGATVQPGCAHKPGEASIHAPARGATADRRAEGHWRGASIHAPARGATGQFMTTALQQLLQSTLPHGERRMSATASCAQA